MNSAVLRRGEKHLRHMDPVLARLIERHGPCDLAVPARGRFHTLVWAIINQQLSVKAARTIEQRLLEQFGAEHLQAVHFYRIRETTLRKCGLSGSKIRYIRNLATRVRTQELVLEELDALDDSQVSEYLIALPGIGRWTIDMLLMFSLGRLDVFPVEDLALRRSMRLNYGLAESASTDAYHGIAERWRPYRTVASWYCWAAVD